MRLFFVLAWLPLVALACSSFSSTSTSTPVEETPQPPPETPLETVQRFLDFWHEGRYVDMYDLLSADSRASIDQEKFVARYQNIAEEATITGIDYQISPTVVEEAMEVPYTVTIHTSFLGDIVQENTISVVQEAQPAPAAEGEAEGPTTLQWRLPWSPSLIFKELDDRTLVHLFSLVPRRGTIYDGQGRELALDAKVPVVGIVPDQISEGETLITTLAEALSIPPDQVRSQVEADVPSFYFVPVQTLPYGTTEEALQPFFRMADLGVLVREETRRIYPFQDSAAHVLGYMTEVNAEQLEQLAPLGYNPGDLIGAFGLEASMEEDLAGKRGGTLATITPEGAIAHTIAKKDEVPGMDIHITIDIDVQRVAEQALGERVGSFVAIDPRDNSVLSLASFPRFNPNDFIEGFSAASFNALQSDPLQPFLHRPLLATYPPGSTFKVVTMAAGLQEGGFAPTSTIHCAPTWSGLGPNNPPRNNWQTVDRGFLTPAQGLMASCNPVFYEIALALDHTDENILPEFASAFGLGQPSGIEGLNDAAGVVPGPDWKEETLGKDWFSGDSVNMGIGQGFLLTTPLQLANMYSALAGDAVLRQPLLIAKKTTAGGTVAQEFTAKEIGPLPISTSTLAAIREGLALVTQNPGGTSYRVFQGSSADAAGKSGTAEDLAFGSDHVFFVAYANRSNPSIMAMAALEEGKSGSAEAGPMVRSVLESYLSSNPNAAGLAITD